MNGDAVTKIAELAQLDAEDMTTEIGGQIYSTKSLTRIPEFCPKVETVELMTLRGFVEFINENKEGINYREYFVHVMDYRRVRLCSNLLGEDRQREFPIAAHVDKQLETFPFGQFTPGEPFIIKLRSLFVSTEDLERLIAYTGKVDISEGIQLEDNGITQTAKIKRGISGALTEDEAAPVIVSLRPYRTFREIEQPESEFLFRMQQGRGGGVECALFEADGGIWRIQAVDEISQSLDEQLPEGLTILT